MFKKLEKSVILVDGLIQSPLSYTPTTTTLQSNGGTVGLQKLFLMWLEYLHCTNFNFKNK